MLNLYNEQHLFYVIQGMQSHQQLQFGSSTLMKLHSLLFTSDVYACGSYDASVTFLIVFLYLKSKTLIKYSYSYGVCLRY